MFQRPIIEIKVYKLKSILFRVDYGENFGGGHLARCLILAKELQKKYKIILNFALRIIQIHCHFCCKVDYYTLIKFESQIERLSSQKL